MLAFVIASAAPEQRTSLDARFERRRLPKFKRLGWLHIVMAIDEEMRTSHGALAKGPRENDGIAFGRAEPRAQSNPFAVLMKPSGASRQISPVFRLGGNAGKADIIAELAYKSLLISFEIFQDFLHW